ncbi:MAG: lipoprotein [Gammaproteobacteria bacterium]|nr:lipoprotein [Gammaproteobacteria bacterium]
MKKLQAPCPRFLWRTVTVAALAFMLAACGQTGPLYRPGPDEETGGMSVAPMAAVDVSAAAADTVNSMAANTVDSTAAGTVAPTPTITPD